MREFEPLTTVTAMNFDLSRLVLRLARPEDAVCLCALGIQVFLDTYATEGIRPSIAREVLDAFSVDTWASMIMQRGTSLEVAEYENHLVGFNQVTLCAAHKMVLHKTQAELCRLYVQEPFTGRGVGRALLGSAEALTSKHGASVLWLTAWVHNHRARQFYAAHGYVDHGATEFRFQGETHENRVLAKVLPAQNAV